MKLLLLTLILTPLLSYGQENREDFLTEMRERSRADLEEIVGEASEYMVPLSAQVDKGKVYVMWWEWIVHQLLTDHILILQRSTLK